MNTAARQPSINLQIVPDRVPPADKNQQFTPGYIADFARSVFGCGIELDPTSSPIANEVIQADRIYTEEQDALAQDWTADTLWFNPPYGVGLIGPMIAKFLEELPKIGQAIVLVNSSTNVEWYQALIRHQSRMLMPAHRIQFWTAEGLPSDPASREAYQAKPKGNNRFCQTIFYFGPNVDRFDTLAADLGVSLATAKPTPEADSIDTLTRALKNVSVSKANRLIAEGVAGGSIVSCARSSGNTRQSVHVTGGKRKYVPVKAVDALKADVDRGRQLDKLRRAIDLIEQIETLIN
jgi:hypothetical protein